MLIHLILVIISQCIHTSNPQVVYLKHVQFYLSVIPQQSWKTYIYNGRKDSIYNSSKNIKCLGINTTKIYNFYIKNFIILLKTFKIFE